MKNTLLLTALILSVAVSFLFSPAPLTPDEFWGRYVRTGEKTGFVLNGDSYGYIQSAEHPDRLLQQNEERQSRPLYVLLGTAVGYPLRAVLPSVVPEADVAWVVGPDLPIPIRSLIGFYPAFVLLNFVVLLAALALFVRLYQSLTGTVPDRIVLSCLLVFLVSSPILKAFFWTAHQQMFCFFTPLFCLALLRYLRWHQFSTGQWLRAALVLGVLPLLYGNFVLVLPTLFYALWRPSTRKVGFAWLLLALGVTVLFLLPTAGWVLLLKLNGVTYYNHEMARFHQLVWIVEGLQGSPVEFWTEVKSNFFEFLSTLSGIQVLLVATPLLWLYSWKRGKKHPPLVADALFLLLLFAGFLLVLGYYNERLTFTLQPLLLCLAAAALPRFRLSWQRLGLLVSAISWHLYQVLSYGPFS